MLTHENAMKANLFNSKVNSKQLQRYQLCEGCGSPELIDFTVKKRKYLQFLKACFTAFTFSTPVVTASITYYKIRYLFQ